MQLPALLLVIIQAESGRPLSCCCRGQLYIVINFSAPAHQMSFSVAGSLTTRLSRGQRPVLAPVHMHMRTCADKCCSDNGLVTLGGVQALQGCL